MLLVYTNLRNLSLILSLSEKYATLVCPKLNYLEFFTCNIRIKIITSIIEYRFSTTPVFGDTEKRNYFYNQLNKMPMANKIKKAALKLMKEIALLIRPIFINLISWHIAIELGICTM